MNKNMIFAVIIILIIAVVGVFALTQFNSNGGKLNTQINFLSNNTLKNGESVEMQLVDTQGNPISNQTLNISYVHGGNSQNYSVITDNDGKVFLVLSNEDEGNCEVNVTYGGDDKYNGCSAKQTITIQGSSQISAQNSTANTGSTIKTSNNNSSSQQSKLSYDSELNVYYDSQGIVRGGQSDGYSLQYLRDSIKDSVDEEGNLV